MTDEQKRCAANGHHPWVFATRTVSNDAFGVSKSRIRYCTGCGMEHPIRRRAR